MTDVGFSASRVTFSFWRFDVVNNCRWLSLSQSFSVHRSGLTCCWLSMIFFRGLFIFIFAYLDCFWLVYVYRMIVGDKVWNIHCRRSRCSPLIEILLLLEIFVSSFLPAVHFWWSHKVGRANCVVCLQNFLSLIKTLLLHPLSVCSRYLFLFLILFGFASFLSVTNVSIIKEFVCLRSFFRFLSCRTCSLEEPVICFQDMC